MKNLIVIIGLLSIAAAGVYLFMQRDAAQLILDDSIGPSESVLVEAQVFIKRREILEELDMNVAVLDDPRLVSLRNFSKPLIPRPVGRPNPFETPVVVR